jgi:hypothetical protein
MKRNRHNIYKIVGSSVLELLKIRNIRMYVINLIMIFYKIIGPYIGP